MASTIGAFYSQSSWIALGMVILPTATEQLVQKLFAARVFAIESIAFIAGTVTYLILSTALPLSFQIGAPLVYLACKAAQAYWFRQPPPEPPASPELSETPEPEELPQSATAHPETPEEVASSELPKTAAPEELPSLPSKTPAVTAKSTLNLAEVAVNEGKAAIEQRREQWRQKISNTDKTWDEFQKIIKGFKRSERWALSVTQKFSDSPRGKTFKASVHFGVTHLFKFDKERSEAFRKEVCMITEETLFFWMGALKEKTSFLTVNLIPLSLLETLGPKDTKFSLTIKEGDQQFEFTFEGKQMARLRSLKTALTKCQQIKLIPLTMIDFSNELEIYHLGVNDFASQGEAKCYLEPFLEVKIPTEGDALKAEPSGI